MARVRPAILLGLIVALAGALGYFVYRDRTREHEYRFVRSIAPCDPDDADRTVIDTREGKFCFEPSTKDVIKQTLKSGQLWEGSLVEEFAKHVHPGDLVVDAGAYIGEHTMQLAKLVGPTGSVVAFEPQLRIYEELLVNLDLNHVTNVRAELAALGDTHARVSMGIARADNEGATTVGSGNNRVELRTLDSYRLERVAFMKVDVEGFERQLLEGARATLERDHPVMVIEVWPKNRAAVMPLLDSLGYAVAPLGTDDFLATPKPKP